MEWFCHNFMQNAVAQKYVFRLLYRECIRHSCKSANLIQSAFLTFRNTVRKRDYPTHDTIDLFSRILILSKQQKYFLHNTAVGVCNELSASIVFPLFGKALYQIEQFIKYNALGRVHTHVKPIQNIAHCPQVIICYG